jgi:iron complex outermembrane receptor protein
MKLHRIATTRRLTRLAGLLTLTLALGAPLESQESQTAALDSLLTIQVSSAATYLQSTREAAAAATVISSEDIERFGYRTLFEALRTERGFYGSHDRNYAYIGVRGFSRPTDYNNRILVMLDGHTINEAFYGGVFPGLGLGISMAEVERIEIVRGPGSALYGSSAMLAVVNVVTKAASRETTGALSVDAESGGLRRGSAYFADILSDDLELTLGANWLDSRGRDLYFPEFDDPSTNDGVASRLDWEEGYGFTSTLKRSGLTLGFSGVTRSKGVPTAPWEARFGDERTRTRDDRLSADLAYARRLRSDAELTISGTYDRAFYEGSYPYEVGDGGLYQDRNEAQSLGAKTRLRWDVSPVSRLILGSEVSHTGQALFQASSEESGALVEFDAPFTAVSAFAQNELSLSPRALLTLGVRMDRYSDMGSSVSPRAALVLHPAATSTVKVLYGEAFRAPSRWEGFYEEEDYQKRNPDLEPEKIKTFEVVMEHLLRPGLLGAISTYEYRMTGLIDEFVDPLDDLVTYVNGSTTRAQGLEVGLRGRATDRIRAYANFALQRTRDDAGVRLSNSPAHLFRAGLHFAPIPQLTAAAELRHDSARRTVWETTTEAYTLADLTLSTGELFGGVRGVLAVRNLFDTSYMTPGGWEHSMPGIPQQGRTFRLTASASF